MKLECLQQHAGAQNVLGARYFKVRKLERPLRPKTAIMHTLTAAMPSRHNLVYLWCVHTYIHVTTQLVDDGFLACIKGQGCQPYEVS